MTGTQVRYRCILERQSRVIAAGLIAELVNQPDCETMIARAMEIFQYDISDGISRLIDKVEEEFEFDFQGVLEGIVDDQERVKKEIEEAGATASIQ